MRAWIAAAACAIAAFPGVASAQYVDTYSRGATVPESERYAANIRGPVNCASPTLIIRQLPTNEAAGDINVRSGWVRDAELLRHVMDHCRANPPRVFRHAKATSVEEIIENGGGPYTQNFDTAAMAAFYGAIRPDGNVNWRERPSTLDGFGEHLTQQQLRALLEAGRTLRRTPVTNRGAWRDAFRAYASHVAQVGANIIAFCDATPFSDDTIETFLLLLDQNNNCERIVGATDIPDLNTIVDATQRREVERALGPVSVALYSSRYAVAARAERWRGDFERLIADPRLISRTASAVQRIINELRPGAPALHADLSPLITARVAALEAGDRRSYAEYRAEQRAEDAAASERARAARVSAQQESVQRLRGLRGGVGPSGYDVVSAIRAEHMRFSYYQAAGPLGVMEGSPLVPGLAAAAREYDVSNLSCRAGSSGGYACTYDLTRRWTTAEHDQSGFFAGLEALANAIGSSATGRNLAEQTFRRTDTFTQSGNSWRSPTWATGLRELDEERQRQATNCTTERRRVGTRMTVSGNRILGVMPEYGLVSSC